MTKIKLTVEQLNIYNHMEKTSDNILVLGKAGTGKSELLKYMIRNTTKESVVLAATGVAALNVEGSTIHSFLNLKLGLQDLNEIKRKRLYDNLISILQKIDTIFIDEISMVNPDIFDAINIICQRARNNHNSFGGIQLVLCGDLYQLPPVVEDDIYPYYKDKYSGVFFFNAESFKKGNFKCFELEEIHRQNDIDFINILNHIRIGDISNSLIEDLNKRVLKTPPSCDYIILATKNSIVDNINRTKLNELKGKEYVYTAKITGDMKKSYFPNQISLHLKVGAKVMMLVNTPNWVNGSLGTVTKLSKDKIEVEINNKKYNIDKYNWKNYSYDYDYNTKSIRKEIKSTFVQYPLTLAYAITIHKSQGKTYNGVLIDLGNGAFADGQLYVALSRCSSFENLYLKHPICLSDIKVNQEVVNFMKNIEINKFSDGKDDKNENTTKL